jgi:hypothetical protein
MNDKQAGKLESYIKETTAVKNGGLWAHVVIDRVPSDMLSARGKNANVRKITDITGSMVTSCEYEKFVNNRLKKVGSDELFIADEMKGKERVPGSDMLVRSVKSGKLNLKLFFLGGDKQEVKYFLDGKETTADELLAKGIITPSSLKNYGSKKQEAAGLDKEEQVKIITVGLDNIASLKCGGTDFCKI